MNQEKNDLLGIAAHNLKNPLANITLLAKILLKDANIARAEVEEYSTDILTTSEQMFDIIKKLLDINAIEQGRVNITLEQMDLTALLRALVLSYRKKAERKNIRLHLEAIDAIEVTADKNYAIQVFDNLLSNAVKYSPYGRNVYVRIEQVNTSVRCFIEDEGPGISPEDMEKMFGKFVTLSARPTGGESATGLGLSIAKRLMEMMNGNVWCESKPDAGATFVVEFPNALLSG